MKKGLEYAFSSEKRALDLVGAAIMTPPALAGKLLLTHTLQQQTPEDRNPVFQQQRVGANAVPFTVFKLRTLDSQTGEAFGNTALLFRKYGVDEMAQARNIFNNQMSLAGHRPIPAHEQEEVFDHAPGRLVDQWKKVVAPTKPGWLSTFSI